MCYLCGDCCDPIIMTYELTEIIEPGNEELDWLLEHWRLFRVVLDGDFFFYDCDMFDHEVRRCRDYNNRPDVCVNYPMDYDNPIEQDVLSDRCMYRKEVRI